MHSSSARPSRPSANRSAPRSSPQKAQSKATPDKAQGYKPGHAHVFRSVLTEEKSPRLIPPDDGMSIGAALLPEPEDNETEERFCTAPIFDTPGMPRRRATGSEQTVLPFPTLVTHLEGCIGQASLLLSDRLRTLHVRAQRCEFSPIQLGELCETADGVAAASYHVQKWASLLAPPEEGLHKPSKPSSCEEKAEAFAAMHFATPRIIVASATAHKGFKKVIEEHGDEAEKVIAAMGIPTADMRALGPHLEALIFRLSRLSARLQKPKPISEFVPQYFAPAVGLKPAHMLVSYLDRKQD